MESGHGSGSSKHLKTYPGATVGKGNISNPGEEAESPSSSSSSDTSLEEFFGPSTMSNEGIPPKVHEDVQLAPKDDGKDVNSDRHPKSGESSDQGSPSDAIPLKVTFNYPDSSLDSLSATQSPQIQLMGRSEEPDPYRIPSSVFARSKSTAPVEWSVASNESLFSIHAGNNSFSRDNIFLMGRSGELSKSGELLNFPDFPVSRPLDTLGEHTENSTEIEGELAVDEAAAETVKEVLRTAAEDHSKRKIPPAAGIRQSFSHSHRSDGSGASVRSFAFPLLTGEGGRSGDFAKAEEQQSQKQPQQQPQPQPQPQPQSQPQPWTPVAAPKAKGGKWFPCFCCCTFCC
ncbi:hypothetical protein NE237_020812 [Protea cynaroides]|uniref:Uncharacterized protein n=1 Tax=Protea cynaroides TaxID=273540 RepID=A0A9Q0K2X7_9MAGN|nr:hypothetical protein NE237_020812 [Protea cynaroides]